MDFEGLVLRDDTQGQRPGPLLSKIATGRTFGPGQSFRRTYPSPSDWAMQTAGPLVRENALRQRGKKREAKALSELCAGFVGKLVKQVQLGRSLALPTFG